MDGMGRVPRAHVPSLPRGGDQGCRLGRRSGLFVGWVIGVCSVCSVVCMVVQFRLSDVRFVCDVQLVMCIATVGVGGVRRDSPV